MSDDFSSGVKLVCVNSDDSLRLKTEGKVKIAVSSNQEIKVGDTINWRVTQQVGYYDVNVEQPKNTSEPTKES